ncbi:MAG: hypothetical protein CMP10_02895 [Zetaproteobacteria bacterium]|nr:hypothetical protein [Pseudobdellovibrionaceae bacterium]
MITAAIFLILVILALLLIYNGWKVKAAKSEITYVPTAEQLKQIPSIKDLPPATIEALIELTTITKVNANEYMIHQGDYDRSLYFVIEGQIDILIQGAVNDILVKTLTAGDFFGEVGFLVNDKRKASAYTYTDCTLIRFDYENFDRIMALVPNFQSAVWATLETYTIKQCLADHTTLRKINLFERRKWFATRESSLHRPGEINTPDFAEWLTLVDGEITINDESYKAPALLRVPKDRNLITAETNCRICWLPAPISEKLPKSA